MKKLSAATILLNRTRQAMLMPFVTNARHADKGQKGKVEHVKPAASHGPGRNEACLCGSGKKSKKCCKAPKTV